jgi:alkaline phosphatase D
MPPFGVPVRWEVAGDERFRRVVRRGVKLASPQFAHSVHAEVRGLRPAREYFYRFKAGHEVSPVGRTRTAPAPGSVPGRFRFAFVSCQDWQDGYFTAYRHLSAEDVEAVFHLGDYVYEYGPIPGSVRLQDGGGEPVTLAEYRNRYALYKTDLDLQAAHAAFPYVVTLDDHEVDNDWGGEFPQDPEEQPPDEWRRRKAAAFRAY